MQDKKVALFPVAKSFTSPPQYSLFPTQKLPQTWPLLSGRLLAKLKSAGLSLHWSGSDGPLPIILGASLLRHCWAQRQSSGSLMQCPRPWAEVVPKDCEVQGSCKYPHCVPRQQENQEQDKSGAASGGAVYDIKGQLASVHSWLQSVPNNPTQACTQVQMYTHSTYTHTVHTHAHMCGMVYTYIQHMHKCTHSTDSCTSCTHIHVCAHMVHI